LEVDFKVRLSTPLFELFDILEPEVISVQRWERWNSTEQDWDFSYLGFRFRKTNYWKSWSYSNLKWAVWQMLG